MSEKGADFSDLQPRTTNSGRIDALSFTTLPLTAAGVDDGVIHQVTPNNSFRPGQQVIFWLAIRNALFEDQWVSRIQLKLWWARPNMEFRQAFGGDGTIGSTLPAAPIDTQVFGAGPNAGIVDNRYVWVPSQKRLDLTQYQTPNPPPASPDRHSDSLLLQDMWTMDLQDPNDAAYTGKFLAPQVACRQVSILYPAMGYALGWTYQATQGNGQSEAVAIVSYNLMWQIGTMGGSARDQESIG